MPKFPLELPDTTKHEEELKAVEEQLVQQRVSHLEKQLYLVQHAQLSQSIASEKGEKPVLPRDPELAAMNLDPDFI